jgi:hypothetical protein
MRRFRFIYLLAMMPAALPALAQRVPVWLAVPRTPTAENSRVGIPANQDSLFGNNAMLWPVAAKLLCEAVMGNASLRGPVINGRQRRVPVRELRTTLLAHPALIASNVAADKEMPASLLLAGIDGVEVGGYLQRKKVSGALAIVFVPQAVRIVWRNPRQDPPTQSLGALQLSSKLARAVLADKQTFATLFGITQYYAYPIQLGCYYPTQLEHALYLRSKLFRDATLLNEMDRPQALENISSRPAQLLLPAMQHARW